MFDRASCHAAPASRSGRGARAARRPALRPRRGALRPARSATTRCSRTAVGLHARRRPAGRRQPRAGPRRARRDRAHLAAIEAIDPGGLSRDGPLRARPRDPQRAPGRSSTPMSCACGSAARSPSTPSATGCSCCSRATTPRWPSGSTRSPAGWRPPRPTSRRPSPGRPSRRSAVAADRARDRRGPAVVLRRAGRRRAARPPGSRAAPPRARERVGQDRRRAVRGLARDDARGRHRRLGDRARAPRRDGRPARVRRPRRRRDPRARLAPARRGARGARRRRPRDRSRRRRDDRHRRESSRTSPADFDDALDAYREAMLRSRRHIIERGLMTVPDDERIDVIATPEYLRNVVPFAAYFEPATFDPDPKGIYIVTPAVARRPERDARAQLRVDQQHQHPRGLPGPPSPARRRPAERVADPDAGRRPGVRRGLGDVLRAADARARLRRRRAVPAGRCTPTRSGGPAGSSSTSGCTAAS